MEILHWKINPELERETIENYRTSYALSLKDRNPLEIINELTFDGMAPDITIKKLEELFNFVENKFLDKKISGVGLEVGSGPGTMSSVLAKRVAVNRVYGVEVCAPIVDVLMPKVAGYILGNSSDKVVGAVGSFDDIELPDDSVDFIFDFFSLHHSNDMSITLKECSRVLKKDGFVLCFDKARPNYYTEADLNGLLDAEYGEADKKRFGVSLTERFTRRMNGEKEYRLLDWQKSFRGAGFSKIDYFYLAKPGGKNFINRSIKNLLAGTPPYFQLLINKYLPEAKASHKFLFESRNKIFTKKISMFPKEICLLVAYK